MVLDTEIFLWYPPAVSGVAPAPRAGHSAALLGLPKHGGGGFGSGLASAAAASERVELVVFGGTRGRKWEGSLHVLNCDRWAWSRLHGTVSGAAPSPRSYHSAVAVGGGAQMVVFGGNDGDKCFDEVSGRHFLAGAMAVWTPRRPPCSPPPPCPSSLSSTCPCLVS
jgi:hypothetical protein